MFSVLTIWNTTALRFRFSLNERMVLKFFRIALRFWEMTVK